MVRHTTTLCTTVLHAPMNPIPRAIGKEESMTWNAKADIGKASTRAGYDFQFVASVIYLLLVCTEVVWK
jgi:hypothetical protein